MEAERKLRRDAIATRLHDTSLDKGSFEVIHILQLGKRLACIENLVIPTRHF